MPLKMRQISLPASSSTDDALRTGCLVRILVLSMVTGNTGIKIYLYKCSEHR